MPVETVILPARDDNYAYLLRDQATGKVATIDAPEEAAIVDALEASGWGLDEIWITHHHGDHTEAVDALRTRFGAKVIGHAKDAARLPTLDHAVNEGDTIRMGETEARIIDVSGHTIGHIAFVLEADRIAFTADSLMALGCGRVFEGTHAMMWESLSKLMTLDPRTQIYSGHNYGAANGAFALSIEPENQALQARIERIAKADLTSTPIVPVTLAEELATNPFLRATDPGVKANVGLAGADDASVFAKIRRRKDSF